MPMCLVMESVSYGISIMGLKLTKLLHLLGAYGASRRGRGNRYGSSFSTTTKRTCVGQGKSQVAKYFYLDCIVHHK